MTVTFFGHTDFFRTAEYERKMLTLLDEVVGCSAADFYLGGIGGFDSFAYDCCKKYKQTHSNARRSLFLYEFFPCFFHDLLLFEKVRTFVLFALDFSVRV